MTATVDDYDFQLPPELIAQRPLEKRRDSRLLRVPAAQGALEHHSFSDIVSLVDAGDLLVFNDTRVIPARLRGHKASGGQVELLLERVLDESSALVQMRASRAPRPGQVVLVPGAELEVVDRERNFFRIRIRHGPTVQQLFERRGQIPLPPYIQRQADAEDLDRYQTVYARESGAVAAPTAGLHFDQQLLSQLREQGVATGFLTLHVGAGTFAPVRSATIDAHEIHKERIEVSAELVAQVGAAKTAGRRVVAVGTTVVRALESAALSGELKPYSGETGLYITPGYRFKVVDTIVTNFHLPRSTLLIMLAAFIGRERLLDVYQQAVQERYRFYSYGDAMLVHGER